MSRLSGGSSAYSMRAVRHRATALAVAVAAISAHDGAIRMEISVLLVLMTLRMMHSRLLGPSLFVCAGMTVPAPHNAASKRIPGDNHSHPLEKLPARPAQ